MLGALESVLKQSLPADEVLVVYDRAEELGARDAAKIRDELLREISVATQDVSVKVLFSAGRAGPTGQAGRARQSSKQKGISAARNTGIAAAKSEWLAFLDDDDLWLPSKLEEQFKLIAAEGGRHLLCHCNEKWLRQGKHLNQLAKHSKSGGQIYLKCVELCCVSPSAAVVHKSAFEKYGGFDEAMPVCEDYDMWLRMCAYEEVLFSPKVLLQKNSGAANQPQLSKVYWGMDRFRIYALQKMLKDDKLPSEYREASEASINKRLGILATGAEKRRKLMQSAYYRSLQEEQQRERMIYFPSVRAARAVSAISSSPASNQPPQSAQSRQ